MIKAISIVLLGVLLSACATSKPHRESTVDNTCLACDREDDTLPGQIVIWRK